VLQSVDVIAGLLAWALFIAVFIISVMMLVRRDASVAFMGIAWVLVPSILLAVGVRYGNMERLSSAPLAEQALWGVPIMWALVMLCLGLPAFFIHGCILLIKELNAR
jgi:hypothetical protein